MIRKFPTSYFQQTATFTERWPPAIAPTDLATPGSGPSAPPLPTGTDISQQLSVNILEIRCSPAGVGIHRLGQ